jgi:hypothetical protein
MNLKHMLLEKEKLNILTVEVSPSRAIHDEMKKDNSLVPEKIYPNCDTCKVKILSENIKKSGIYRFTNLIDGKYYIGSSENLSRRLRQYFNINYLIKKKIHVYLFCFACTRLFQFFFRNSGVL